MVPAMFKYCQELADLEQHHKARAQTARLRARIDFSSFHGSDTNQLYDLEQEIIL